MICGRSFGNEAYALPRKHSYSSVHRKNYISIHLAFTAV